MIEILITISLIIISGYIIYKNIKKSSKGDCNCSDCHTHCSKYEDKIKIKK